MKLVTPDTDRIEALYGWLQAHVRFATHRDQLLTLEGRASGLLEILGALREHAGDVRWFPVRELMGAPSNAMVTLQVRAGDLWEMSEALRQVLERMRREP